MMGGMLVLNEIMDYATRNKRECLLVKLDFATMYDCVLLEYLRYMLGRMIFGARWLRWTDVGLF